MTDFFYHLYGLRLRSALELPELAPCDPGGVDVTIRLVDRLPDIGTPISIDEVADFAVDGGHTIFVAPASSAKAANVRLFLLGSAMGLLIHQRGELPLHANSMAVGGEAVMVMGASGSGKSSLAAWMAQRGFQPLSDDVCVVRSSGSDMMLLFPGVARFRLWEDALERNGIPIDGLAAVYEGDPSYRKFNLPIGEPLPVKTAWQIGAAYVLEQGDIFSIEALGGMEAVSAYFAHTYRGEYVQVAGQPARHWAQCVALAAAVPTFRIARTMDVSAIDAENHQIQAHMKDMVNAAGRA